VTKPEHPAVVDQKLTRDRLLDVVEQLDRRPTQHRGQQLDVELRADHRRAA